MTEVKKQKKMIKVIVPIVGIVVVAGIMVAAAVLLLNQSGAIRTLGQLKTAIQEKKAFNCTISQEGDGGEVVMQTTEGFSRVKLTTAEPEISEGRQFMLMVGGDGTYLWDEAGTMAFKMSDTSTLDEFIDEINTASEEDEGDDGGFNFRCEMPDSAMLEVPSDVEFLDLSDETVGGGEDLSTD